MGASLALAGVAGLAACRRPDHKILAFNKQPEDLVTGNPLFYATAIPGATGAQGLLVRTIDGRPIKLEGNPLHPINQGKSDVFSQAAILDLYDADRLRSPMQGGQAKTWADFDAFAATHFGALNASGGEGLAFLVDRNAGPTRNAMRARVMDRWPRARWVEHDAIENDAAHDGSVVAFGAPHREVFNLARAKVVLAVARDFMLEPGAPRRRAASRRAGA